MVQPGELRRLLVPVKGTEGDPRVIELLTHFATRQSVAFTFVYVVEVQQSMALDAELPTEIEHGERVLRSAESLAHQALRPNDKSHRVTTELLQARSAGSAIVDEAIERGADAIVMAARIRKRHGKPTVGETVNYVLKNAPCEVMVVRLAPHPDLLGGRLPA
jgi:nucleotide-binding universal stress UspA family protein